MNITEPDKNAPLAAAPRLAKRSRYLRSNTIRDMFKVAGMPGMIALGGGNPAAESFPVKHMPQLMEDVMKQHSATALQYCDTQGFFPLREVLAKWLNAQQIPATPGNIVVTTGSQNALDLLAKLLIDHRSPVVGEHPTYLGALQAFSLFAPRWSFLEEDNNGPTPESLRSLTRVNPGEAHLPLLYVMPAFRNPSGKCWSEKRLQQAAHILGSHGNWVIEDDPYRLLNYDKTPPLPLKNRLPQQTIYIGSLSKVFAPGLRLGYCVVPDSLLSWMVKAKQGTDLNTGTLSQALAAEYIQSGLLNNQLPQLISIYRTKRDALADALRRHLPDSFEFSVPEGGMFIWVKGPPEFDSERFLPVAIRHGVFFVPGAAFFSDAAGDDVQKENMRCMRLNFSGNEESRLAEAARRLGLALEAYHHEE